MSIFKQNKQRVWPIFLAVFVLLFSAGVFIFFQFFKNLEPTDLLQNELVKKYISEQLNEEEQDFFSLLPEFLGSTEPKHYLVLFLNDTEIRPGGGFIGSYGVLKVDKGNLEVVRLEGTEILDGQTPDSWQPVPPTPIAEHLHVDRWYFRDSNWSPDFMLSSKKSLEFYQGEGGVAAGDIDAVVGISTSILEEILKITGPVEVNGIEFSADNVIEKLEYEVEYGYYEKGVERADRKQIMQPLAEALLVRIKDTILPNISDYEHLLQKLIAEKHLLVYAIDEDWQEKLSKLKITGEMTQTDGDYLLWADANLAALKTDLAIDRTLNYSIKKNSEGKYVATVTMTYLHNGVFDWRTTRYRTYARIFVPVGSTLVDVEGAMKTDRSSAPGTIESGVENGRQWFGTFIAIEPGKTGTLTFTYVLPEVVTSAIANRSYTLFVQKQLGTEAHELTMDLNFDTNIKSAYPGEEKVDWGNNTYTIHTDLRLDREFKVNIE